MQGYVNGIKTKTKKKRTRNKKKNKSVKEKKSSNHMQTMSPSNFPRINIKIDTHGKKSKYLYCKQQQQYDDNFSWKKKDQGKNST